LSSTESIPLDVRCCLCGSFIAGAGPGLCYVQNETEKEAAAAAEEAAAAAAAAEIQAEVFQPDDSVEKNELPDLSVSEGYLEDEEDKKQQEQHGKYDLEVCDGCYADSTAPPYRRSFRKTEKARLLKELPKADALSIYMQQEEYNRAMVRRCTILNRAAEAFVFFSGVRPTLTISPNSFRNMVRRCHLCEFHFLPSIDLMYMEVMREWQSYVLDRSMTIATVTDLYSPGLPFPGFVMALFRIAKVQFRGSNLGYRVDALLSNVDLEIRKSRLSQTIATRNLERMKSDGIKKVKRTPLPKKIMYQISKSKRVPYF